MILTPVLRRKNTRPSPWETYRLSSSNSVGMLAHQAILHACGHPCRLQRRKADHAFNFCRFFKETEKHDSLAAELWLDEKCPTDSHWNGMGSWDSFLRKVEFEDCRMVETPGISYLK